MSSISSSSNLKSLNSVAPVAGNITLISSDNSVTFTPGVGQLDVKATGGGGGGITNIDGDSGSATGATVTITGGTSGAVFTGAGDTVTTTFDYLSLPDSTSTSFGVINISGDTFMHAIPGLASHNLGIYQQALENVSTGFNNIALGFASQQAVQDGTNNVSVGTVALVTTVSGTHNAAFGTSALQMLGNGNNNTAIGAYAGSVYAAAESNNILIGSNGVGGESNTIRIGVGNNFSDPTNCLIAGIFGATVTGSAVLIDSTGLMGTVVSSERYKKDIVDLADESSAVMDLRPVSFAYKSSPDGMRTSGLIAEEVEKILPRLVVKDKQGITESVMYHELPVLLLNEMKKMSARIESLEAQLGKSSN